MRVFGRIRVSESSYAGHARIPRHTHPSAYLSFVIAGRYTETVGRRSLLCSANVLRYHALGEEHADAFEGCGGSCLNIELPSELVSADVSELAQDPVSLDSLAWPALRVRRELRRPDRASALVVEELAAHLVDCCRATATHRKLIVESQPVVRAIEYIEAHLADNLTLGSLAAAAGVHETHLARVFRRRTGMTAGEFVRRRRIARAQLALRDPALAASVIGTSLGFADHAHFSRTFRRVVGVTPTAFRRICNN